MGGYDELYEKYKNGEIDTDEFLEMTCGDKFNFDLDQRYEKPRKKKKKKKGNGRKMKSENH